MSFERLWFNLFSKIHLILRIKCDFINDKGLNRVYILIWLSQPSFCQLGVNIPTRDSTKPA